MLFITVLLSSCSSRYDESMKNAKEAMLQKQYEEAINQLEVALIEKPTDKFAKALMENAKEKLLEQELNDSINEFLITTNEIYKQVIKFGEAFDVDIISVGTATDALPKVIELKNSVESLHDSWANNDKFSTTYNNLFSAINSLKSSYESIAENIVDENLDNANEGESRSERLKKLRNSNDSRTRAMFSFHEYELYIESYKRDIIKLEKMLVK